MLTFGAASLRERDARELGEVCFARQHRVVLLYLHQLAYYGRSIHVFLILPVSLQLFNELRKDFLFFLLDLSGKIPIEVRIDDVQELVENFGDTFLVEVSKQAIKDI